VRSASVGFDFSIFEDGQNLRVGPFPDERENGPIDHALVRSFVADDRLWQQPQLGDILVVLHPPPEFAGNNSARPRGSSRRQVKSSPPRQAVALLVAQVLVVVVA